MQHVRCLSPTAFGDEAAQSVQGPQPQHPAPAPAASPFCVQRPPQTPETRRSCKSRVPLRGLFRTLHHHPALRCSELLAPAPRRGTKHGGATGRWRSSWACKPSPDGFVTA